MSKPAENKTGTLRDIEHGELTHVTTKQKVPFKIVHGWNLQSSVECDMHWKRGWLTLFTQLSETTGLRGQYGGHGPRLHDLRHRFAVETLLRWYRGGRDVDRNMYVLSTYLGHTEPSRTYWYLSCTPVLMGEASRLLEKRWEEVA